MRKLFLLPVVVLAAVGCGDFGDPVTPDTVNPYDVERPDILLLEWEARGAIPAADVNRDGSVDILDLIIVAQNFGQDIVVEDPPVRVDAFEVKPMGRWTWSYKLTLTNTTADDRFVSFRTDLFDSEGFYLRGNGIFFISIAASETRTVRNEILVAPDVEYYDEDGNRVLSVDTFPRNAEEFVAVFKQ